MESHEKNVFTVGADLDPSRTDNMEMKTGGELIRMIPASLRRPL